MRSVFCLALAVVVLSACGQDLALRDADEVRTEDSTLLTPTELKLHFVLLHGVQWNDAGRLDATESMRSLDEELRRKLNARLLQHRLEHPEVRISYETYRLGLYTDASGALRPPLDEPSDGTGVPSAERWRRSLSEGLSSILPPDARNIILIGHSTGGRVAMELTANVGGAGLVGGYDWGWQDRIAGVVTINGMLDALNSPSYNFLAAFSFVGGCKIAQGDGWCEYAGLISAVNATDWVAQNKRALTLVTAGSCGPATWTGESDQVLPLGAQSSPRASGLAMTPSAGETFSAVSGVRYGSFCHTDITHPDSSRHLAAREEVSSRIVSWLFNRAPRETSTAQVNIPALPSNTWSPTYSFGTGCGPAGEVSAEVQALGTCIHPGYFDGGDHPFDRSNDLEVQATGPCQATVRWRHRESGSHAARLWVKLHSQPLGGGLISTLY